MKYVIAIIISSYNTPEHETRTGKCSDTCQHNIKFVLIFTKNDLTLVETYAIALNFGLDTCQIKVRIAQVNTKICQTSRCYFML